MIQAAGEVVLVIMQDALGPRTSVFLSDVETDTWPRGQLDELAARSARWLITRGEHGAHEYANGESVHLPPEKVSLMHCCFCNDLPGHHARWC